MKTRPELQDRTRAAFLRLSAGALALAAAACAQAPFGERHRAGTHSRRGAEGGSQSAQSLLEESLAEFRDDLHLTANQQPAWQRYASSLQAFARDAARERAHAKALTGMTLSERLGHQVDVARDRYAAMEDITDAARALYATLDPEQQTLANPRLAGIVEMVAGAASAARPPSRGRKRG